MKPIFALRNVGPCANESQPFGKLVNAALHTVNRFHLLRQPILVDLPRAELLMHLGQQRHMLPPRKPAKIRYLAYLPQPPHLGGKAHLVYHIRHRRQPFKAAQVIRLAGAQKLAIIRAALKRGNQRLHATKIQTRIAPFQLLNRRKPVVLDRLHPVRLKIMRLASHPEGAIFHIAPRPARNLCQLIGHKIAHPATVKFGKPGKSHMRDIKVQPHANRIGGDQIIDLAVLIHLDLRIARARAKRPHHHRSTTLLAANKLGDLINILY